MRDIQDSESEDLKNKINNKKALFFICTSTASSLSGPQYIPDLALRNLSSAWYVLPELVGPAWNIILRFIALASGYQLGGFVRSLK